jgi:hypothetical protein
LQTLNLLAANVRFPPFVLFGAQHKRLKRPPSRDASARRLDKRSGEPNVYFRDIQTGSLRKFDAGFAFLAGHFLSEYLGCGAQWIIGKVRITLGRHRVGMTQQTPNDGKAHPA